LCLLALSSAFPTGSTVCANADGVRIRSGPCTDQPIVGVLNTGDSAIVTSNHTTNACGYEWCAIKHAGVSGYSACEFLVQCGAGRKGIDLSAVDSQNAGLSNFQCWVRNGFTFAIIQVWVGGIYHPNPKTAQVVADAWAAGMDAVDVYVWMCPNCQDNNPPESVADKIKAYLVDNKVKYGMLWFDVELCDNDPSCWNDPASNAAWLLRAVKRAAQIGLKVGIYSQNWEWLHTVGGSTAFNQWPLWYANWDGKLNFDDGAYKFGGWSSPAMKQYYDHGPADCGIDVDLDWHP